ncbi:tannase and feruloyl esterase-domain-containing protein [Chaetomium tenue]|uniref:Tannase and feruloyl esterase-domain-containing protein n=1 Tax=Chaetomium tenue TaxID=1854479 RepID=A0ACB7NY13_9PEZI|nr:tannase and feruloyl esterase-domain-containing protein [Chaetomium globosum]
MRPQRSPLSAALFSVAAAAPAGIQDQCSKLASSLAIENATIHFAQYVTAGTNMTFPDTHPSCSQAPLVVDVNFCRVSMHVATSSESGIRVPLSYDTMAYTVGLGFSTAGTNNGHNGTSGEAFLNNPQTLEDFSWRSIHTNSVVGKQVSETFYGEKHKKSYLIAWSMGGRQGFKSAQDFPEDVDGIVAGAPALDYNNFNSLDGILEEPSLCQYRPESLICEAGTPANTSTCITSTQVATVRAVYSDLHGEDGKLVYPGLRPGVELATGTTLLNGQPFPFSDDWVNHTVYNGAAPPAGTLGPADWAYMDAVNPGNIRTWSGDLSAVRDRGAKILQHHGLQGPVLPDGIASRYYDYVARTMNLTPKAMDEFYRYFRISGMEHCFGGPGATNFGQRTDPIGTTFDYKRRHCRYPFRNVHTGSGDPKDPDTWECVY